MANGREHYSPLVPGHEIIGHVAAVGEGAGTWKVGDRVGGAWHGGHDGGLFDIFEREGYGESILMLLIGTCKACKKGLFQMCDNEAINGETRDGGCECS